MPRMITLCCRQCGKYQVHEASEVDEGHVPCSCPGCGTLLHCDQKVKRFVLDGPPGSGKSTVLFGLSDGETGGHFTHTMQSLGYGCIHESVAQAHQILANKGIDFAREKETWLRTIVEIDRDKYFAVQGGVSFFDRCFHHWQLLSEVAGIRLPDWYDELNRMIRYDDPIFVCAPVQSMDLTDPRIMESRRFTWSQRLDIYDRTKSLYRELGYQVVEVPVFREGDIEGNNKQRIEHILQHAGLSREDMP